MRSDAAGKQAFQTQGKITKYSLQILYCTKHRAEADASTNAECSWVELELPPDRCPHQHEEQQQRPSKTKQTHSTRFLITVAVASRHPHPSSQHPASFLSYISLQSLLDQRLIYGIPTCHVLLPRCRTSAGLTCPDGLLAAGSCHRPSDLDRNLELREQACRYWTREPYTFSGFSCS